MPRVLHVLAQRPGRTGSGVTLDAIVRETERAGGWEQQVVCGVPAGDEPSVGGLAREEIHALCFGDGGDVPFPVPGMSDVMPYESTVYASMSEEMVETYLAAWRGHLARVRDLFRPDVVHVHHLWLVGALCREIFGDVRIVGHCHATGLRQMELVPALAERVRRGNAENDVFCVLHDDHAERLGNALDVDPSRIHVVGAGYREDMFPCTHAVERVPGRIAYAGKLSAAKGIGELFDAIEIVARTRPDIELHMAGGGSGDEADRLRARIATMERHVQHHGFVDVEELAEMFASAEVFVLPSYYEGLPLALVEAAASGCKIVASDLQGVRDVLAPVLGPVLRTVSLPEMETVDKPKRQGLPGFTRALARALESSLADSGPHPPNLAPFRWSAVAARVRDVWAG